MLEGFLNSYQNSVVKVDALEQLLAAYQQAGNVQKLKDTAQRLLQADPNNIRALAILTALTRQELEGGQVQPGQAQQVAQQLGQYAEKGLQALPQMPRPEGMNEQQYGQIRTQVRHLFVSALGFASLQTQNYPEAQGCLQAAVQTDPNNLGNVYPLALAYLQQNPPNPIGFWYAARAVNLAPPQAKQQITAYGHAKYVRYHGDESGWNELLQQTASAPAPPPNFTVAPAPTPPEQAAKMVASKPVSQMSFDEIQFVLTSGNQQAADTVWNQIKGKPIAIEGKLVNGAPEKLSIAGTYDDIQATPPKPDIDLTMTAPIPKNLMPKEGAMFQFQGVPTTYDPNPFLMHMDHGMLIGKKPAATPPARRRTGTTTRRRRPQ
jgi:hypothetical protein